MHAREPFWQVQSVFDPEGNGSDFGYTIGLAGRGVPELHLWARPSLGDDPGEDWHFSHRDVCYLLNGVAWRWLDGELRVGDRFEREYDNGLVTVRFHVDPPQDAHSLDAFGAGDSPVVPIRWSLERPPLGPPVPLTRREQLLAELRWIDLVKDLDLGRSAPTGWRLPKEPCWSVDQKYGPRTPLVLALAARLWQADAEALGGLVQVAGYVDRAGSLTGPMATAATAARGVGRQGAVAGIMRDVHDLCHELGARWLRRPFAQMQREVMGQGWTAHEQRHHTDNLRHLLADITASAACVESVGDVLSEPISMAARGPFLAGFLGPGLAPGPSWVAPPGIVAVVQETLHGLRGLTLVDVVETHLRALEDVSYLEVHAWLATQAVTSAASAPDVESVLDFETHAEAVRCLCARELGGALQEWVTDFVAAMTAVTSVDEGWLDPWAEPYASLVPGLSELLVTRGH